MRKHLCLLALVAAVLGPARSWASDHADPAWLPNNEQEANLTGLFFFPKDDRYVLVLDTRASLTAAPPYHFAPYAFSVGIDTHSAVKFPTGAAPTCPYPAGAPLNPAPTQKPADVAPAPKPADAAETYPPAATPAPTPAAAQTQPPAPPPAAAAQTPYPPSGAPMQKVPVDAQTQALLGDFCRYGGSVVNPGGIGPDVKFTFTLEDNATLKSLDITGLKDTPRFIFNDGNIADLKANPDKYKDAIWVYTGVRDDPFIFPKFFTVNVVTMTVSIPKSAFQTTSQDWLLWASSSWAKNGKKIDHVGRSNRTQLGRFDVLNTEDPKDHVKVLQKITAGRVKFQDFLKQVLRPLSNLNQLSGFLLRSYDYAPDVMIFSTRYPPGFPNGRRLEDDVAAITCAYGDCPLQENSYIDSKAFPRALVNDKPLLADFPYLADPWPFRPQPFVGSPWIWFVTNLLPPIVMIVIVLLLLWALWRWICARLNAATAEDPETSA